MSNFEEWIRDRMGVNFIVPVIMIVSLSVGLGLIVGLIYFGILLAHFVSDELALLIAILTPFLFFYIWYRLSRGRE